MKEIRGDAKSIRQLLSGSKYATDYSTHASLKICAPWGVTFPLGRPAGLTENVSLLTIRHNNTRQGYAPRSTLKPAGYFFPGSA